MTYEEACEKIEDWDESGEWEDAVKFQVLLQRLMDLGVEVGAALNILYAAYSIMTPDDDFL